MSIQNRSSRTAWPVITCRSCRITLRTVLFVFAVIWCPTGEVRAQETRAVSLDKIRADWRQRLASSRTMRYRIVGTYMVPKGTWNGDPDLPAGTRGDIPPLDHTSPTKAAWTVDLQNGMMRMEVSREVFDLSKLEFCPDYYVNVFDASTFRSYRPRRAASGSDRDRDQKVVELYIEPDHMAPFMLSAFDYPVLFAHGIFLMSGNFDPRKLAGSSVDQLTLEPTGWGIVDDRQCAVVRTTPIGGAIGLGWFDEFWVDMDRDSAVSRWARYCKHELFATLTVKHQQTPYGWLPRSWTATFYAAAPGGQPEVQSVDRASVTELAVNFDAEPSDFKIPLYPGMIVRDNISKMGLRVAEDGETLVPLGQEGGISPITVAGIGVGLVAVVVAAYLLARRRRRAAGSAK